MDPLEIISIKALLVFQVNPVPAAKAGVTTPEAELLPTEQA